MLTVELLLRISFSDLSAATVLFMYMLSMYSISSNSGIPPPFNKEEVGFAGFSSSLLSPFPSSLDIDGSLVGRSCSSMASHCFTSLYRRSVVKKGCCRTFWMKGSRIRAPVLLSYFLRILTSPVKGSAGHKNINDKRSN
jgi:hypothetical protein